MNQEEKKSITLEKILLNIGRSFCKLLSDTIKLGQIEAQLARKSLIYIIILSFIIFFSLWIIWLVICAEIISIFLELQYTLALSLFIIAIIHVALILFSLSSMKRFAKNMCFTTTRRQLDNLFSKKGER